jgi:hypothetical protein
MPTPTNQVTKAASKTAAKTKDGLNLKQEEFCRLYASADFADRDFFGNGAQCYLEVYGYTDDRNNRKITYETARANASRLLTNANVIQRINELLETGGFNDANVDKHHLFLINQFADLKTKMTAIKEYNALKKRVSPEPGENTFNTIIFTDGRAARIARRILTGNSSSEEEPR